MLVFVQSREHVWVLYTQEVKYQPGADQGWTKADQTYIKYSDCANKTIEQNAWMDFGHKRTISMIILLICVIYHIIRSWWSNNKNTTITTFFSSDYKELFKLVVNTLNHKLSVSLNELNRAIVSILKLAKIMYKQTCKDVKKTVRMMDESVEFLGFRFRVGLVSRCLRWFSPSLVHCDCHKSYRNKPSNYKLTTRHNN